jgi:Xaa-Pro dipeptidase
MVHKKRIKKIFNIIPFELDVILIKNSFYPYIDENFFYVTGLNKGIFENSAAIIHSNGDIDLIVSELEEESAKKADSNLYVYKNIKSFNTIIEKILASKNVIGLNFDRISHEDFFKIKRLCPNNILIKNVTEGFMKARLIKDDFEIDIIKQACKISDKVMEKIPDYIIEGMYEFEMGAEISYLLQKNGADEPAFEIISSFGKNSAEPHYSHGNNKLRNGDFALFDFGAKLRKYNSDITRTYVFGKASKKQRDMYETILEAQKIGLDIIKPGKKAHEVHDSVKSYINKSKFKDKFIHSTGHSIGLGVHDSNIGFNSDCKIILKEKMVFSVEPGIYLPGFGGVRIEDDILIKKNGIELLTNSSKHLIEI